MVLDWLLCQLSRYVLLKRGANICSILDVIMHCTLSERKRNHNLVIVIFSGRCIFFNLSIYGRGKCLANVPMRLIADIIQSRPTTLKRAAVVSLGTGIIFNLTTVEGDGLQTCPSMCMIAQTTRSRTTTL